MEVHTLVVGPLETNCYILTQGYECVIIDPGAEFEIIREFVKDYKVVGCLLTHSHDDHIGALEKVLSTYNLSVNQIKSNNFKHIDINTPGHTKDSKCYYFENINTMFCGDFLFKDSIGRIDLGGNKKDMINSLELMKSFNDNIILYPGHGPQTTLGREKTKFEIYKEYI